MVPAPERVNIDEPFDINELEIKSWIVEYLDKED